MFTVVAVDAKLEPLLKDYLPLYETAREEQIRMIRWNRQGGSVQTAPVSALRREDVLVNRV